FGQGGCKITGKGTIKTGTQDAASQEVKKDVSSLRYIALPNWVYDALLESSSMETLIPTVSSPVPTACFNDSPEPSSDIRLISKRVANQVETPSLDNILTLTNRFEDILGVTTNSVDSDGVDADVSNMETTITEPKKIYDALQDPSWVEAMQEELFQFKIQNVWTLVDFPKGVTPIGIKWVLKNKKDERGIVIRNKTRLVAQGHTEEEGIDYDEVFAPVVRTEAIRLFLAYASFMGFTVYQMDVKSAFLYASQEVKKDVSSLRYIALPNWVHDALLESSSKPSSDTRLISKRVANQVETPSLDNILTLINRFEDILGVTTNSVDSDGVEADVTNMETNITASPTPILRIHKNHPKSQIIGPVNTPIQTMNKFKEVLKNKKDERGIVIRNKARLVAQRHAQKERIDYDEMDVKSAFLYGTIDEEVYVMQPLGFQDPEFLAKVYKVEKAMYRLHQAPRAWYNTLSKYLLTNGFQRGTIDQTLFIRRQRGDFILVQVYVDDIIFGSSNPQLCREFEALMHEKFQMSAMGDILKKFRYSDVRSLNTPLDKENPWGKDRTGKDVDLHLYRSMIGSLMYLTASRPDIMFATIVSTATTEVEYVAAASCCRQVLWIQNQLLDYGNKIMARLQFYDYHNLVAILEKSEHNIDFHPIVDFVEASPLRYALTFKPTVYVSHIRQFWSTARIETTEERTKILAIVDGILRTVIEPSLRRNLKLQDEEGISSLPKAELFENLTLMGYNISLNQKFTFQKGQFSHQWKYLIHTIMQCLSPKSSGFNEFSSNIATALVCLATNRVYNFSKMIFDCMVKNVNNKVSKFLMYPRARMAQSSALPPIADEPTSPLRDVSQGKAFPTDSGFRVDQDRENIAKTSTLPYDLALRVTSPAADEGRDDAPIKGRNLDEGEAATERVSDDTEEMATVLTSMDATTVLASGVADVPTGSGSILTAAAEVPTSSYVVPTAGPIFAIATVITPYTRRKGKETMVESETPKKKKVQEKIDAQVARELEEQMAREDQRMSKQVARDADIARIHAEEELQIMIDGLDRSNETIAKYLQKYHQFALELPLERRIELISDLVRYQDNYAKVHKYQSQQRKPWSKKQKRDYYMAVVKSNLGWKVKDFRGMTFEEIEEKFTTVWKQIKIFIPMGSKEEAKRFKRKGIRFEQESAKKLKTSEEVPEEVKSPDKVPKEKVKDMMQLVPIEEVYVEALQVKHPIIDWKNLMHALVEWKLYDMCGVHQVTSKDKEIFMLVEKDYPLRKGLAIGMISYKLKGRIVGNEMHKAFPLPVMEFPLPEEVSTASEESFHYQKKRDATAVKIALLLKSRRNCQSKSYDSFAKLVPHVTPCWSVSITFRFSVRLQTPDDLSRSRLGFIEKMGVHG
nr:hypothetical protein [Tanacetum cinerariifolium]